MKPAEYPPPFRSADYVAPPTDPEDERIDVGVLVVGNCRKCRLIIRGAAPVAVERNDALQRRLSRVARENGSMYHI